MSFWLRTTFLVACLSACCAWQARAQFVPPTRRLVTVDTLSVGERLAWKTNATDWLLTVPNLGVEFDLGRTSYNHLALGISGRWNWDTHPDQLPYNVLNLTEGRVELRAYWHPNKQYWRTFYVGGFAAVGNFDVKFSHTGHRGDHYMAGMSAGIVKPLYAYKRHVLDLELGVAVGALHCDYDDYELLRSANAYVVTDHRARWMPMLSELRVALAYRHKPSARTRYRFDQQRHLDRLEQKAERRKERVEKKTAPAPSREGRE